jgi:hypothetical protein
VNSLAAALIVALGPTVAIIVTYILAKRERHHVAVALTETTTAVAESGRQVSRKLDDNGEKLEVVHELVNSRMAEALKRIAKLEAKLGLEPGEPVA